FEAPRVWVEYPFAFRNAGDKTNAVSETSIAVRACRNGDALSIVAANTTDRDIVVDARMKFDEARDEIRFAPLEVKFLTARGEKMKTGNRSKKGARFHLRSQMVQPQTSSFCIDENR